MKASFSGSIHSELVSVAGRRVWSTVHTYAPSDGDSSVYMSP
jgi:hypothetical protein